MSAATATPPIVCAFHRSSETAHRYSADRDDLKLKCEQSLTFEALPGFVVPVSRFFA
jgi:hypothetical protein